MQAKWAVAIVEPNRDFTAEQSLRRDGYRVVFLYRRKLLTGHRGDWRKTHAFVSRPLFEGYGFIQLWPGQEWPQPARVQGFTALLGGPSPIWLDPETIDRWQSRTQAGDFDDKLPEKKSAGPKFQSANSEDERLKVLGEFRAKIAGALYADAS